MTYKETIAQLNSVIANRNCTIKEKEALYKMLLIAEDKAAEEEKINNASCTWYIGNYYFHRFQDALQMAKKAEYKNTFIIEKRIDENGNVTSKKYKLSNGQVLGVQKM